jgi:hypothetical protein
MRQPYGFFSTTAWAVEEYFSEAEWHEALNLVTDPIADKLVNIRKTSGLELPSHVQQRCVDIQRTREHEWTHFRQHISTQLGLFLHRLHGLQEYCTLHYFRHLATIGGRYLPLPFTVLQKSQGSDDTAANLLKLWRCAEAIAGALWCKTTRMGDLISTWNVCVDTLSRLGAYLSVDGKGARLSTSRSLDDQSCPDDHISGRDLVEGFATYKELVAVVRLFSPQAATKFVMPKINPSNSVAFDFINEFLGIPPYHILTGALLEVATKSFLDPMLYSDAISLEWEKIHPGWRFEDAIFKLQETLRAVPDNFEDAYDLANSVFEQNELASDQTAIWISQRPREGVSLATLRSSNSDPSSIVEAVQAFHKATFVEALAVRKVTPAIFYETQLYDLETIHRYASMSRPTVLIQPDGVFIPHGAGRDTSLAFPFLLHSLSAFAWDEISHEANLRYTWSFVKKVAASIGVTFIDVGRNALKDNFSNMVPLEQYD